MRIRVDLDVKEFDRLFLPIQSRRLIHAYSDAAQCQADIQCVKLEELLASKLKALLQRQHSPDLYDFVHAVFFQKVLNISRLSSNNLVWSNCQTILVLRAWSGLEDSLLSGTMIERYSSACSVASE